MYIIKQFIFTFILKLYIYIYFFFLYHNFQDKNFYLSFIQPRIIWDVFTSWFRSKDTGLISVNKIQIIKKGWSLFSNIPFTLYVHYNNVKRYVVPGLWCERRCSTSSGHRPRILAVQVSTTKEYLNSWKSIYEVEECGFLEVARLSIDVPSASFLASWNNLDSRG